MTDLTPHIHQCPYCEVRFLYANEVKDHVIHEHPEHAAAFLEVTPVELPQ
jgi:hypothetical protein